jgi:3-oxoacyl-[acyl-carrier protein] reductase
MLQQGQKVLAKACVNAIAPGVVDTEGTRTGGIMGSDFEKEVVAGTPLGRFGQPDDIARIAGFLGSQDSAWLTGKLLTGAAAESKAE